MYNYEYLKNKDNYFWINNLICLAIILYIIGFYIANKIYLCHEI